MFESGYLQICDKIYGWIISLGSNLQSLFLLYMRLVWGHQFFVTGIAKFNHIDTVVQFFLSINLPHPVFYAYTVAGFELIGGFCLFLGLMSRLAAIPLIAMMVVALSLAHAEAFVELRFLFEPMMLVHQAPYPFLLTALLVFIFGPGRISLDAWIKRWVQKQAKY